MADPVPFVVEESGSPASAPAGAIPIALYQSGGGGGGSTAWADITEKPSTFPPSAHTQAISTITGLQAELDSKATPDEIPDPADFATAAQGAKADTAVQPAAIANFVPNTRTVAGRALTTDVPRASLNTLGLGEAVFIPKNGTVPGGTPTYTIVIEAEA